MGFDRILSQILSSGAAAGVAGGLASGLLTSKAGRKLGKKALRLGGLAAVGGLAYVAWRRYQQTGARAERLTPGATAAGPLTAFVPPSDAVSQRDALGLTLLHAMIAAAQADGKLDGDERRAIFQRVEALGLPAADKAALFAQLGAPVDLGALVAEARTPEIAAEIYTASLLAIECDTAAERGYLAMLAARLGLPDGLVAAIHQELALVPSQDPAVRPPAASAAPEAPEATAS